MAAPATVAVINLALRRGRFRRLGESVSGVPRKDARNSFRTGQMNVPAQRRRSRSTVEKIAQLVSSLRSGVFDPRPLFDRFIRYHHQCHFHRGKENGSSNRARVEQHCSAMVDDRRLAKCSGRFHAEMRGFHLSGMRGRPSRREMASCSMTDEAAMKRGEWRIAVASFRWLTLTKRCLGSKKPSRSAGCPSW